MRLIKFPQVNVTFAEHQPEYNPLPAHRVKNSQTGEIICCWELTWAERLTLLLTGKLWHHILTFDQMLQPQLLQVDNPLEELGHIVVRITAQIGYPDAHDHDSTWYAVGEEYIVHQDPNWPQVVVQRWDCDTVPGGINQEHCERVRGVRAWIKARCWRLISWWYWQRRNWKELHTKQPWA